MIISDKGTIIQCKINDLEIVHKVPIYSFIFKNHSFVDTRSYHYDDKLDIENKLQTDDNTYTYSKKFEHFNTKYHISHQNNFILLKMYIENNDVVGHSFGFVIPAQSKNYKSYDENIDKDIIKYNRVFERIFRGHQIIKNPIMSFCHQESNKWISIFLPANYNSQFFIHNQHNEKCIRVSANTDHTNNIEIYVICHDKEQEISSIYKKFYPKLSIKNSENYSYQNIENTYHIKIQNQIIHNINASEFSWQEPTTEEIQAYLPTMSECLSCYKNTIAIHDVLHITLVSHMQHNNKSCSGFNYGNDIVLDISDNRSVYYKKRAFHHEMFHFLDKDNDKTQTNRLNPFSGSTKNERQAEIFSTIMTNPGDIDNKIQSGISTQTEINSIYKLITDNKITPIAMHNNIISITKNTNHFNLFFVIGAKHSGLSLLTSILSCSHEARVIYPNIYHMKNYICSAKEIGHQNIYNDVCDMLINYNSASRKTGGKIIFPICADSESLDYIITMLENTGAKMVVLIREPFYTCSKHSVNEKEFNRRMQEWHNIYNRLINNCIDKFIIRHEDVVLKIHKIKELFNYIGMVFSDQFMDYGDFEKLQCTNANNNAFISGHIDKDCVFNSKKPDYVAKYYDQYSDFIHMLQQIGYHTINAEA